ncbi:hypothetical protein P280DRAFT_178647 [Massarina eburnea CBS 473.64]|uniref:BTB domain-containing protein n=1 Tax=Massarina eburnea CBS 473.64 TaxID=1395130 RepID=A0A6A6SAD0_9PLEO|nr:hypothetical protein P280DRAFT_178647 [Massarina eburnea CBS 473.64]
MAPPHPDTAIAATPQRQARRSVPRIIPAIPHRFAKPPAAARPITPDESTTAAAAVTRREPTPQPAEEKQPERAATPLQAPLTPESKVSTASHGDTDELVPAISPAHSGHHHAEEAVDSPGPSCLRNSATPLQANILTRPQAVSEDQPEPQPAQDALPTPQPAPTTAAVNGERPKPTVPTELPPEFYPREKTATHTPVAGTGDSSAFPPPASFPLHPLQPSVEGLVFGGLVQESPAMPSTPQDLEPEMSAPQPTFARPPPGLAPHLAPQFFPGHSHHPSEPTAAWLQPTYSMAPPPEAIYGNGHDYTSPTFPAVTAPYQAPYPAPFPLQTAPPALNGTASSHTLSPSKSQFGDVKPVSNGEENIISYVNGTAPHRFEGPSEGYEMARHVFGLFGNPEFTDYVLHIRSPEVMLLSLHVHAAIISRSPVIMEALRRSAPPAYRTKDPRRVADILTDDAFVTPESLHEAIKILYGAPLLSVHQFMFGLDPYDRGNDQGHSFNEARRRMGQAISYAAAGRVLQIPEMQTCGLRVAKALLRWDTVDQVLHFGLTANKTTVQPSGTATDSRLLETYAVPLLDEGLEFIAYNFPSNFALYTLAPEMRRYPRLPTVIEQRQPTHNPRLSKIRFGDAPPEDDLKPSHISQVLSSILLSLPLPLLDRLFSHPAAANQVGWSGLVKIMRDVVAERERRRQKALEAQLTSSSDGSVPRALLENLHREERVDPSIERPSGFILTSMRPAERV